MNKRSVAITVLSCLWLAAALRPALGQDQPGWTLVWSDEFSQPNGSSPDPGKWKFDLGAGGWGNNEWQYYTSRTNNARIEDGKLVIEARKENYQGSSYTSARLLTKGKWAWTYGRMEARLKLPRGQGIWPAFWTLGANIDTVKWPQCGEIDIMENIGREPTQVHGTIHGPGYSGENSIGAPYSLPSKAAFADDFHVFAVEWDTNRIRWFVDDKPFLTLTPAHLPQGAQWVFDKPHFILLNLAVGGRWPGYPDATTTFPQQFLVDYVRVYQNTNRTGCPKNALLNPGLELGSLGGWVAYGSGANTVVPGFGSAPVRSGASAFKVFGQFTGTENYSGIYQDLACAPGTAYSASGWALSPLGDRITGGNTAWLEVSFRDAADQILSFYRSREIDASTSPDEWMYLPVTNRLDPVSYQVMGATNALIAPPGANRVRYQVVFRQPSQSPGAVLFDDLRFAAGASESLMGVLGAAADGQFHLNFPTLLNWTYQVSYKNDLSQPEWQALKQVRGNGTDVTVLDALNASGRYYRVHCLCN